MRSRWVVAVAVLASTACSDGTNSAPNNTAEPPDPRAMVSAVAAAQCRKILDCCDDTELESVLGPEIRDQARCEAAISSQAEAFLVPAIERALASKTIVFEEHEVARCVEALDARTCAEFEPLASADVIELEGCTLILRAKLALSGFCTNDFECESGFCSHPPADIEGTCKNAPQLGEPCLHDRCDDFLRCSPDGICAEALAAQMPCTRNADCRSDRCTADDSGVLVCEAKAEICYSGSTG